MAEKISKGRPLGGDEEPAAPSRAGRVALIGRPNVGKSTLLNAALDMPLAIVSPTPQTTRDSILGVVRHLNAEIALLDTPGLHRPRTELGRRMNRTAREAAQGADVVVFVTDLPEDKPQRTRAPSGDAAKNPDVPAEKPKRDRIAVTGPVLTPHTGDVTLLADIGVGTPTILVVNKIDRMKDKRRLFPLLEAYAKLRAFDAVVPISALKESGVERVLDEVAKLCPVGPPRYSPDELTDRPTRFFAAEYVREQILRATKEEVPHSTAVVIDEYMEPLGEAATRIAATIHVERPGQKKILIGAGGEMLKRIGTKARMRIEELTGRKVHLELWVKVTPSWREEPQRLEELGYGSDRGRSSGEEGSS